MKIFFNFDKNLDIQFYYYYVIIITWRNLLKPFIILKLWHCIVIYLSKNFYIIGKHATSDASEIDDKTQ